jgi:hypothetical protein
MSSFVTIDCTAGSSIDRVSADAQRIADLLGISVDFRFNDVHCVAVPGGSADHLAEEQQRQQSRKLERPMDIRFARSLVKA